MVGERVLQSDLRECRRPTPRNWPTWGKDAAPHGVRGASHRFRMFRGPMYRRPCRRIPELGKWRSPDARKDRPPQGPRPRIASVTLGKSYAYSIARSALLKRYWKISVNTRPIDPLGCSTLRIAAKVGAMSLTATLFANHLALMPGPRKMMGTWLS